ncbi:hypothetical protein JCM10207_007150 [Rhodosporidiobolus poonsookiae]
MPDRFHAPSPSRSWRHSRPSSVASASSASSSSDGSEAEEHFVPPPSRAARRDQQRYVRASSSDEERDLGADEEQYHSEGKVKKGAKMVVNVFICIGLLVFMAALGAGLYLMFKNV